MFVIGIPWSIKPIFGLLTDFVPLRGSRRRSWLILTSLVSMIGLFGAAVLPLPEGATALLVLLLFLPSVGIAFTDVATDAYMVDTGQPLGITGRLQSAQWTAIYAAGLLTGVVGGFLSEHGLQRLGFVICGSLSAVTLYVAIAHVREPEPHRIRPDQLRRALTALKDALRNRTVVVVAAFLFLINFNPFSADVLYVHMTETLGFGEQLVGTLYTLGSLGSILAGVLYGIFSPRIPLRVLVHGSIALMVVSSLLYLGMSGRTSAVVISLVYGFVYLVTSLIQLDIAARYCPLESAGTVFAALMSLINLSVSLSSVVGGGLYTSWTAEMGSERAFTILVLVGAGVTALTWVLYHLFPIDRRARG